MRQIYWLCALFLFSAFQAHAAFGGPLPDIATGPDPYGYCPLLNIHFPVRYPYNCEPSGGRSSQFGSSTRGRSGVLSGESVSIFSGTRRGMAGELIHRQDFSLLIDDMLQSRRNSRASGESLNHQIDFSRSIDDLLREENRNSGRSTASSGDASDGRRDAVSIGVSYAHPENNLQRNPELFPQTGAEHGEWFFPATLTHKKTSFFEKIIVMLRLRSV
jgi:hypothetical protein